MKRHLFRFFGYVLTRWETLLRFRAGKSSIPADTPEPPVATHIANLGVRLKLTPIDLEAIQWSIRLNAPDLDPRDPEGSRRRLLKEVLAWSTISPEHRNSFLRNYVLTRTLGIDSTEIAAALSVMDSEGEASLVLPSAQTPKARRYTGKRGKQTLH